jgi:hypothetical protein
MECRKLHSLTAVGFCAVFTSLFHISVHISLFAQKLTKITFILYVCGSRPEQRKYIISCTRIASFNSQKSLRTTETKQLSRVKVHYLRVQMRVHGELHISRHLSLALSLVQSHRNANTILG